MKVSEKQGGTSGGRRVVSGLAAFFLTVLLASETVVVVSYAVPTMAILLFQYGQISIDRTVAIGEFAMADAVVLMMMWGAPLLVMCGLAMLVQWQVMKRVWKVIMRFVMVSVGRGEAGDGRKGDSGV